MILVVIGVIATALGRSEAITCYSCLSASDSSCLDPFKSSGIKTCKGAACTKGKATSSDVTFVIRGCIPIAFENDGCADETVEGARGILCACRTDYCNDGQLVKPTLYNVVIGVAMATVTAIGWIKKM